MDFYKLHYKSLSESKNLIDEIILSYDRKTIFNFIDTLTEYMDFYDKDKINILKNMCDKYPLFCRFKKSKVFRVMVIENMNNVDFGKREFISTSTSKLKGKVLKGVIGDMVDRYSHYKKIKGKVGYVQIQNPSGIDVEAFIKEGLNKNSKLYTIINDDIRDVFKRLKDEKEFLVVNKNLKISDIEILENI